MLSTCMLRTFRSAIWQIGRILWLILAVISCSRLSSDPVIWFISGAREIRTINPRTMEQKVIVPKSEDTWIDRVALSPDGQRIVYVLSRKDGEAVWLSRSDGSQAKSLIRNYAATAFLWLSDSKLLLFGVDDSVIDLSEGEVYLYDALGGIAQRVDYPEGLWVAPVGSSIGPSGKFYIPQSFFKWGEPWGIGHLEIINGKIEKVLDIPINGDQYQEWSFGSISATPDIRHMVIVGSEAMFSTRDLFAVDGQGKIVRRLTFFSDDFASIYMSGSPISPDGKWVAFYVSLSHPRLPDKVSDTQLMLMRWDQRESKTLVREFASDHIVWSPDSRYIATSLRLEGSALTNHLCIINIETGEKQQLVFEEGRQLVFDWR
jgi:Tol biopolymer transport system component